MFHKTIIPTVLLTSLSAIATPVNGPISGGGGDLCEKRIQDIRDDLASWIQKGGAKALKIKNPLTVAQYEKKMLEKIQPNPLNVVLTCDNKEIEIDGASKTCENYVANGTNYIHCSTSPFMEQTSESNQYVLIHHEYAALAKLEVASGSESHYEISDQISGFLENTIVKKLVVRPVLEKTSTSSLRCKNGKYEGNFLQSFRATITPKNGKLEFITDQNDNTSNENKDREGAKLLSQISPEAAAFINLKHSYVVQIEIPRLHKTFHDCTTYLNGVFAVSCYSAEDEFGSANSGKFIIIDNDEDRPSLSLIPKKMLRWSTARISEETDGGSLYRYMNASFQIDNFRMGYGESISENRCDIQITP